MNWLKKGPELKMPDLKASNLKMPPVISDVYWDLRDRHLLPLVALVVVAIVAVPFLLSGGSKELAIPATTEAESSTALSSESNEAATLTVVKATPGLRDYRKRLARRTPKNPFKQKYTGPVLDGTQLGGAATSTATTSTAVTGGDSGTDGAGSSLPSTPQPSSPQDSSPGSSNPPGGASPNGQATLFAFAINVWISKAGDDSASSKKQEPVTKEKVLPLTPLPGEKAPVVTYMGASKKGKALLMVSNDVKSVFGETKCVSGDDVCQLLEAEPGFPVTFVYGEGETRYTIKVLKLYPVAV